MRVYVCGNPLLKIDSLPLQLLPELHKKFPAVEFIDFDPAENFPNEKEMVILDTVVNAPDVILVNGLDKFVQTKAFSLHDFDLGTNLFLAKKMGWVKRVQIIGVPPEIQKEEAILKIGRILDTLQK